LACWRRAQKSDSFRTLHDGRHPARVERQQVLLPADARDETGVELFGLGGAGHFLVEVGPDLEDLVEPRVEVLKHFKGLVAAQQDDLDLEGDRFGPQGRRA
jgi:hypothetical protein